jgi:DNA-binding Lrp family transcriptional regulator
MLIEFWSQKLHLGNIREENRLDILHNNHFAVIYLLINDPIPPHGAKGFYRLGRHYVHPPLFEAQEHMIAARLDKTDWLILKELQANGRITNVELASRVGMSSPPCLRRVRALEEEGVISGYCALVNEKHAGFDVTAFAMVGLHRQSEADLVEFEERIRAWPAVRECFMLSGEIDFILKCVTRDLNEFQEFIINDLTTAPNLDSVKTSLAIRRSKFEAGIPVDDEMNVSS